MLIAKTNLKEIIQFSKQQLCNKKRRVSKWIFEEICMTVPIYFVMSMFYLSIRVRWNAFIQILERARETVLFNQRIITHQRRRLAPQPEISSINSPSAARQLIGWRYAKQSSSDLVSAFPAPFSFSWARSRGYSTITTTTTIAVYVTRIERFVHCTKFFSVYVHDRICVRTMHRCRYSVRLKSSLCLRITLESSSSTRGDGGKGEGREARTRVVKSRE